MALLYKGSFAFDDILASGYTVSDDIPVVSSEMTTASGYTRRTYLINGKTSIVLDLCHLSKMVFLQYMEQLSVKQAEFRFWSPKYGKYRKGLFYIDMDPFSIIAEDDADIVYEHYNVTLTQAGAITDA